MTLGNPHDELETPLRLPGLRWHSCDLGQVAGVVEAAPACRAPRALAALFLGEKFDGNKTRKEQHEKWRKLWENKIIHGENYIITKGLMILMINDSQWRFNDF